jgi:hypothetical protein
LLNNTSHNTATGFAPQAQRVAHTTKQAIDPGFIVPCLLTEVCNNRVIFSNTIYANRKQVALKLRILSFFSDYLFIFAHPALCIGSRAAPAKTSNQAHTPSPFRSMYCPHLE